MDSSTGPHLGFKSHYTDIYDPTLLVGIDRRENRDGIGYVYADDSDLPFRGYDIWNAFEISALLESGLPFVGHIRLSYPALSPRIVESKSLKLYLNSFNQTKMGKSLQEAKANLLQTVQKDLHPIVGSEVDLTWVEANPANPRHPYLSFLPLELICENVSISHYSESVEVLSWIKSDKQALRVRSSLLKSRCKQTGQPDWGDVFVFMESEQLPTLESLLKLIVSFRQEMHFHEEIVEALFHHLYHQGKTIALMVTAQYTRRGGIDINPVRFTQNILQKPIQLLSLENYVPMPRQ